MFSSDEDGGGEDEDDYSDGSSFLEREGSMNCGLTDRELDAWHVGEVEGEAVGGVEEFEEQVKTGFIKDTEDMLFGPEVRSVIGTVVFTLFVGCR